MRLTLRTAGVLVATQVLAWVPVDAHSDSPSLLLAKNHNQRNSTDNKNYGDPNAELISIVHMIEAAWVAKNNDEFSDEFEKIRKFDRKSVKIFMLGASTTNSDEEDSSYFHYDNGVLTLAYEPHAATVLLDNKSIKIGSFVGQNGFGVKRRVRVGGYKSWNANVVNFASIKLKYQAELDAEKARLLNLFSRIEIDGNIYADENGRIGSCEYKKDEATFDDPREVYSLDCSVNVKATRVKILSRGVVLTEVEF